MNLHFDTIDLHSKISNIFSIQINLNPLSTILYLCSLYNLSFYSFSNENRV